MDDELKRDDELRRALDALDARAAKSAARVNVERVSARVLERLRSEPAATPGRWLPRALRVAAAVALLVIGGVVAGVVTRGERAGAVSHWLPLLPDSLSQAQADSLIEAIDEVRAVNVTTGAASGSVEELSEQELRALLQAMQTSEGGEL